MPVITMVSSHLSMDPSPPDDGLKAARFHHLAAFLLYIKGSGGNVDQQHLLRAKAAISSREYYHKARTC
jgi:hypothetical protein